MTTLEHILDGQMLDETRWVEIDQFCAWLRVDRHWIVELVEAGVLEPRGSSPDTWAFPVRALLRARATARLVADLEVNLPGAAVILDLIEDRARLTRRLAELERHLGG